MSDSFNGWEGQQIPYSQEAEEAVIGSVLINPIAYFGVASFLQPDDFFILRHKYIWHAFKRLIEQQTPIDYLTVTNALREMDKLADIGGPAYLTQLINSVPTSVHAEVYGQLVERAAVRRRLMSASDEIKALALNEEMTIEQVVEESGQKLFDASDMSGKDEIIPFREMIMDYYDTVDDLLQNKDKVIGLPTGFTELDKLLGGLQKGDLLLLGGRPGMGKSAKLLSICMNIFRADRKKRIAFFPIEMGKKQLVQRAVSLEGGINLQSLRGGKFTTAEYTRFVKAAGEIADYPFFIDDRPALTPLQMHAQLLKLTMGYGPLDLVCVDYVQLMSGGGMYANNKVQEIGYIAHSLKNMAKEFNVPIIGAASLSRAVEQRKDKRPVLSDLRETGDLESDADIVMFIYRDEVYNEATLFPNQADVIIAKHRNGPTGTVTEYFEKTLTKFMNAAERSVDLSHI